jgi:type IX secretion system PorP/SprF family membrane protein
LKGLKVKYFTHSNPSTFGFQLAFKHILKTNFMRHLYFIIAFLFFSQSAFSQQYPLFTNFMMNRYGFNPAINLDTAGVVANLVYRNQWTGLEGAPKTMVAGLRGRMKPVPIGMGGYFFNDQAGVIKRTGGYGMFNFVQPLAKDTRISVGASIGYYSLRLAGDVRVKDDVDQVLPVGLDGKQFIDFNAGVYLQSRDLYAGFSIPQVLEEDIDFTDQTGVSRLLRHYYALAGYKFRLNDKLRVEPSVLVKFVENAPTQVDGGLKVGFDKFWLGGTYRSGDAGTVMAGVDLGMMEIAYGYDVTTSNLRTVSSGSHEISLELRFGKPKDSDGDGCPDKEDKCPDKPGPKENDCCPDEEPDEALASLDDSDGDGVPDKEDKCPDTPGPKSNQGCPWGDRDGDGIRDDIDKCPDLPGVASNQGCPVDDRDKDGIVDKFDKCPDEPGSLRNEGCPSKDTDGDGIVDHEDKCPLTKGLPENFGCPVATIGELDILELAIRNLYFDTGKSDIWKDSYPYLNRLSELLVKRTDWKLKIKGFTDARASSDFNLDLSKRRAEAVMFYLVNRGVSREQLMVEFYGEQMPAASNTSEGGQQLNRRVEMEFIFK